MTEPRTLQSPRAGVRGELTMLHVVQDGERPAPRRRSGWAWVRSGRRDVGLIELVAALVGEPGSDAPGGVHPTLAAVGRAVSDLCSPTGRRELRPLALSFPDTAHSGLATPARLVDVCASAALAGRAELVARDARRLESARRLARSLLSDRVEGLGGAARWWLPAARLLSVDEPLYRCLLAPAQAVTAVELVARSCVGRDRDRRLRALLSQCLTSTVGNPEPTLHTASNSRDSGFRVLDIGGSVR